MAVAKDKKTKGVARKRKATRRVDKGCVHIHATSNNTIVTFSDLQGNVISWSSAGKLGLRGSKKSTPFAAQIVCEDAAKRAKEFGLKTVEVYVKGVGAGRESAIRALIVQDIGVTLIKDVSPIPHNGCRPPKMRRL